MENSYPRKINIRFPVFLFLSFRFDKKRHCLVIKKKKKRKTGIERNVTPGKWKWIEPYQEIDLMVPGYFVDFIVLPSFLIARFLLSRILAEWNWSFFRSIYTEKLLSFLSPITNPRSETWNWQSTIVCTLCVLLTHSSYFDVFEGSKLIAVLLVKKCLFFVKNRILAG